MIRLMAQGLNQATVDQWFQTWGLSQNLQLPVAPKAVEVHEDGLPQPSGSDLLPHMTQAEIQVFPRLIYSFFLPFSF